MTQMFFIWLVGAVLAAILIKTKQIPLEDTSLEQHLKGASKEALIHLLKAVFWPIFLVWKAVKYFNRPKSNL